MKRALLVITVLTLLIAAPAALAHCGKDCCDKADKARAVKEAKDSGFCLKSASKAIKQVKNLDNGVQILFAVNNDDMAQQIVKATKAGKILGCEGQCPTKAKGVVREAKMTKEGVVVTATSPDAEMIQHLQKTAKKMMGA